MKSSTVFYTKVLCYKILGKSEQAVRAPNTPGRVLPVFDDVIGVSLRPTKSLVGQQEPGRKESLVLNGRFNK
jgi:hypothetical protein